NYWIQMAELGHRLEQVDRLRRLALPNSQQLCRAVPVNNQSRQPNNQACASQQDTNLARIPSRAPPPQFLNHAQTMFSASNESSSVAAFRERGPGSPTHTRQQF